MARKFFNEFERGFEQDSPYREDIKRLGCIMNRDQLEQNDIISTFKVRDRYIFFFIISTWRGFMSDYR